MIHNFSEKQEKMFAAITEKPYIAVRVKTWKSNYESNTVTYTLMSGEVVTLPLRSAFLFAKKKLLYLPVPEEFDCGALSMQLAQMIMKEYESDD